MRWSMTLRSPWVVAGRGGMGQDVDDGCTPGGELALGPDAEGRRARVRVCVDGGWVEVTVLAEGRPDAGVRPDHPEWSNRAYLAVLLNPGHDHATRWMCAVDDRGRVAREAHWAAAGEEAGDDGVVPLDRPPAADGTFEYRGENRFFARLRVEASGLWRDPAVPAGLAVRVGFHEARIPDALAWPEPALWTRDTPLVFGDLYRCSPLFAVREVVFPEPVWGRSRVLIRGRLAEGAPRAGRVSVRMVMPGDSDLEQEGAAWEAEGPDVEIEVPVVFPFRAKWANGVVSIARLALRVVSTDGRVLWGGRFPFGFDRGIIVRERFGPGAEGPAPRPGPSHPDFLEAFRRFVLTRFPDYRMRTTREGAPSDFYLEDPAGKAHLDLSAADALDRVAELIESRFPDWQDALCAVAMWVHHPLVTRHSSTWSRVSNQASVESIPRLAGCFCGDTTRLAACLAEKVGARLDVPLRAFSMGLRGHLGTLVETPTGAVVIDGMLGLWFHTLDNTRLATLDEMRACREIAERVWFCPRAHGHEFFYGVYNQLIRPWKEGVLRWPEAIGGPVEGGGEQG